MLHSPGVSEAVWAGGSRTFLVIYTSRFPQDADNRPLCSLMEIQTFLVTLVQKYDVSQADHLPQIRRARPGMEVPIVLGEEHKGSQLPLKISTLQNA